MKKDIAILGGGAAGMFVALAAQARGLSVALFEPHARTPNNFAISGGLFPAAGSRFQRAAGIDDSPQAWLDDLRQFAPDMVNERIAQSVAEASRDGRPLRLVLRCFDTDIAHRIHAVSDNYTLLSEAKIAAEVFVKRALAKPAT